MSTLAKKRIVIIIIATLIVIGCAGCKTTKEGAIAHTTSAFAQTTTTEQLSTTNIVTEAVTTEPIDVTEPITEKMESYEDYDQEAVEYIVTDDQTSEDEDEEDEEDYDSDSDYDYEESYIIVNIETQTLQYYENDVIVLESPVVTGGDDSPTPRGEFEILNKKVEIVLRGDDYESPVEYWMAFLGSSYGIHDASWRTDFGDDIYTYNGSHGCINMPLDYMAQLYQLVDIGTPVFIE